MTSCLDVAQRPPFGGFSFMLVCIASLLLTPVRLASAQAPSDSLLRTGARVRVVTVDPMNFKGSRLATGVLVGRVTDSLKLQWENGASSTLAHAEIRKLHVRVSGRRYVLRGMGAGFLLGVTLGAAVGIATYDSSEPFADVGIIVGAAGFGALGTVIGAIVGANGRREAWQRVRLVH